MAKYSGKDMAGTIGSTGLDCITSVDITDEVDTYVTVCGAQTYKERVVGPRDFMATINYTADTSNTILTGVPAGTSATFTLSTNGTATGYPQWSVSIVVASHTQTLPVEGIVGGAIAVEGNGPLGLTIPTSSKFGEMASKSGYRMIPPP